MRDYDMRRIPRGLVRGVVVYESERRELLGCVMRLRSPQRPRRPWSVYDEESLRVGHGATLREALDVLLRVVRRCQECARPLGARQTDCLGCARDFAAAEAPGV